MKKYTLSFLILILLFISSVIFSLSLQDSTTSNALSTQVTDQVLPLVTSLIPQDVKASLTPTQFNHLLRELAHIIEFFILSFFTMLALQFTRYSTRYTILLTLLSNSIIAITDELIQLSLSPGRAFQFIDLAKDLLGIGCAILFFLIFRYCILFIASKIDTL